MLRAGARVPRGCRWGALGLGDAACGLSNLRRCRRKVSPPPSLRPPPSESYQPSYASIVVDANSGAVMQATNADSLRHPASLTKIMTLYLLFERLEAGKIKLSTEMTRLAACRGRRRPPSSASSPARPSRSRPRSAPSSPSRPMTSR